MTIGLTWRRTARRIKQGWFEVIAGTSVVAFRREDEDEVPSSELGDLLVELSFIQARSNAAKKVADGLSEFETYIYNNREFIPNFGERRRQGKRSACRPPGNRQSFPSLTRNRCGVAFYNLARYLTHSRPAIQSEVPFSNFACSFLALLTRLPHRLL